MRKYILILLALFILSGCHADTVPETEARTEETAAEIETADTETETVALPAETAPEMEEDDSESETATDTSAETELQPETVCYNNILYVDADPPYLYREDTSDLPDFLKEELKILYQQAETVFAFFNGDPTLASFVVPHEHEGEASGSHRIEENGRSYFSVEGKYQKWEDFKSMVLHVFTEEYFQELNHTRDGRDAEIFIERDGKTYGLVTEGAAKRNATSTTYELQSKNWKKICFTATYTYIPADDDPEWSKYCTIEQDTEILLQNTEDGWRFAKFNRADWYREDDSDTSADSALPPGVVRYHPGFLWVDTDPPYPYEADTSHLPDFLTEEQKILYKQADAIFPCFNGDSMGADFFVLHKGESVSCKAVEADNGYDYMPVIGKYHKWENFRNMILNVFTEELFQTLNCGSNFDTFIEIDGNTYNIFADKGCGDEYYTDYELLSMTEEEVRFQATYHYDYGTDNLDEQIFPKQLTAEFILQNTENGWRFSKFNSGTWYRKYAPEH